MDEESNPQTPPNDSTEETVSDDFNADLSESEFLEITPEEQIKWLARKIQILTNQMQTVEHRLAEIAIPLPTPESLAESAAQILRPEMEAMRNLMNELQESVQLTPPQSENPTTPPENTDTRPTEPREENPEENREPEAPPAEVEPVSPPRKIRIV